MAEDAPTLPGWVDERLDEIFSMFPEDLGVETFRDDYASCLAEAGRAADPEAGRAGCRAELIRGLETLGVDKGVLAALNEVLEAVEAEIGEDS